MVHKARIISLRASINDTVLQKEKKGRESSFDIKLSISVSEKPPTQARATGQHRAPPAEAWPPTASQMCSWGEWLSPLLYVETRSEQVRQREVWVLLKFVSRNRPQITPLRSAGCGAEGKAFSEQSALSWDADWDGDDGGLRAGVWGTDWWELRPQTEGEEKWDTSAQRLGDLADGNARVWNIIFVVYIYLYKSSRYLKKPNILAPWIYTLIIRKGSGGRSPLVLSGGLEGSPAVGLGVKGVVGSHE